LIQETLAAHLFVIQARCGALFILHVERLSGRQRD
jgi:hypothetical protein